MAITPGPATGRPSAGRQDLVALVATLVTITAWNLGRSAVVPAHAGIPANLAVAAVFGGIAWLGGLGWDGVGLAGDRIVRGLAFGGVVFGAVLVVLVLVSAVPATSGALTDHRVHVGTTAMLFQVLVAIPFGTVVLEELAFRGTLLGLLLGRLSTPVAVGVTSVFFGLWHIKGVLHDPSDWMAWGAVVGTVAATTMAGVGFAWLRLRSGSLLAPIMAHIATNSLAFAVAWAYWRS